jgi:RNA 3'-terminal phosphate cyclase (ATP)
VIEIDGSHGEGGGQILRTALALSCITGAPFRLVNLRRGRPRPGLQPQHLASVRAAGAVCDARVLGEAKGSTELVFHPGPIRGGDFALDVGTAGSVTLVLQTLVPALLFAGRPGRVRLTGGTHVPWSPSYDYLAEVFAPALSRLGGRVGLAIARHGFYPAGGGAVSAEVQPAARLRPLIVTEEGGLVRIGGTSAVGRLPLSIAARQREAAIALLRGRLGDRVPLEIETRAVASRTPGTFIFLRAESPSWTAGFCAVGAPGKRAEAVGEEAALALLSHAGSGAPVDPHLADQLVPYLAVADGDSEIATSCLTRHLMTNLWTAGRFLPVRYEVTGKEGAPGRVRVAGASPSRPLQRDQVTRIESSPSP